MTTPIKYIWNEDSIFYLAESFDDMNCNKYEKWTKLKMVEITKIRKRQNIFIMNEIFFIVS